MKGKQSQGGVAREDGCDVWDHCLTCPRVRCIFDEPPGRVRGPSSERERRQAEVARMRKEGRPVWEIARAMGIGESTVYHLAKRAKREA